LGRYILRLRETVRKWSKRGKIREERRNNSKRSQDRECSYQNSNNRNQNRNWKYKNSKNTFQTHHKL
jgi:hypothetical protein